MRRVVALLMENQPGALSRVVGLFSQRGYNIESLIVAPTNDPSLSRLTMTTDGDTRVIEQITKQLNKLIDVVKVIDLSDEDYLGRELLLIKLELTKEAEERIKDLGGDVLFKSETLLNAEFVGNSEDLDKIVDTLSELNLLEVVRTGLSGISSTSRTLTI
ncbi:MAG: acetolactate synthase small subunit [SAR86 cluster bacterium]|nr:acetolactate synthase small subunit [SAR86 cluster bacterium]